MLTREQFTKEIRKILIEEDTTATELGEKIGESQQNINKKIRNASFGYVDFVNLLDVLGYEVIWVKKTTKPSE